MSNTTVVHHALGKLEAPLVDVQRMKHLVPPTDADTIVARLQSQTTLDSTTQVIVRLQTWMRHRADTGVMCTDLGCAVRERATAGHGVLCLLSGQTEIANDARPVVVDLHQQSESMTQTQGMIQSEMQNNNTRVKVTSNETQRLTKILPALMSR